MVYIFNLVYLVAFMVGLPFVALSRVRQCKSFSSWPAKFWGLRSRPYGQKPVWFHAVSVGEVNLIATLIREFRVQFPDQAIVVSTSTDTGFELANSKFPDLEVFYFPWDFSWAIHRTLRNLDPSMIVLAELEIWPNLMRLAEQSRVPVAVVNGRLSKKSFAGYQRIGFLARSVFAKLSLVAAQDQAYADRFAALGVAPDRLHVAGSIKFDGACTDRNSPKTLELKSLAGFENRQVVWLAGSTQAGEDEIVLDAFTSIRSEFADLRLVIAPRHPHRAEAIAQLIRQHGLRPVLRSQLTPDDFAEDAQERVIIIDGVGELGSWWGVSQIAFVGGSLGSRGGQNMIEPAAKGNAVCFGPNTSNFRDVVSLLLGQDAAKIVHDKFELSEFVAQFCRNPNSYAPMIHQAQQIVASNRGATHLTCGLIAPMISAKLEVPSKAA